METNDPVVALASKSISDRAAGCRDLSLVGTVEHIEVLANLASMDRSPGVRGAEAESRGERERSGAERGERTDTEETWGRG